MPKIYNANDILRYIYNETSDIETTDISHLVHHNSNAAYDFNNFSEQLNQFNAAGLNPHPTSIELILEYAHKKSKELI